MAYNPFDVFRRNQKGLFAVLTVFIMIMFTLNFGAGDFFQWLPTLLGKCSGKGDVVAKIDGKKVTDGDLAQINAKRALASEFMMASLEIATRKMDSYLHETLSQVSKENRPLFIEFNSLRSPESLYLDRQFMMQVMMGQRQQSEIPQRMQQNMFQLRSIFKSLTNSATTSKEDSDFAKTAISIMDLDTQRIFNSAPGYFGHKADGEDGIRTAFDFDLWLHEADKLGIKYSEAEARKLYLDEFFGQIDGKSLADMEQKLYANRPGVNRDAAFQALADEFRVRVARNVVLGRPTAPQVFPTPWDAYEFYRKECNGGTYAVISVPSENYISKVTGEPSEAELRKLFDTYRAKEPDPSKDGVGLREPRKLKLGWLEVKGDEPFYKKLGADTLTLTENSAKARAATLVPLPGAAFGSIAIPAVLNLADPALAGAYTAYGQNHSMNLDMEWFPVFTTDALNRSGPLDGSILKPQNVAAAVAAAFGSIATHGSPLTMPLVFNEKARMEDRNARARALAPLFLAPTEAGSMLLASALASAADLPPPLPLAVVRHDLIEKVKIDVTREAAERDIKHFQEEAAKLGAKPDKTEAKAYIAKFVQERGLKTGESKAFHDQWTMQLDEGLKPLIEKQERGHSFSDIPLEFGRSFFYSFDPIGRREVASSTFFAPEPYPEGGLQLRDNEPSYLAWRTEEQPAETPKNFADARPRIVALWKRLEAKKLAAAAAEELAKQMHEAVAKEPAGDQTSVIQRVFSDLHVKYQSQFATPQERERSQFFVIDNVSPISSPRSLLPRMQAAQPQDFQLTPRREMPFPTPQMQAELLAHKDDKPATTIVLHDESRDRYFVAVLKDRQDRRSDDFYKDVYNGLGPLSNRIQGMLQNDERRQLVRNATALLKADLKVEILSDKLK